MKELHDKFQSCTTIYGCVVRSSCVFWLSPISPTSGNLTAAV
jgi:hypothetical protein